MGIFDTIKNKVAGVFFGETIQDYGVIARAGSETFNLFLAEKDGKASIWLKITQIQQGSTSITYHMLDKNAAGQVAARLYEALKYSEKNQVNLT